MAFIEFLWEYETKKRCSNCFWNRTPHQVCECDPIYKLTRLRVKPNGSINKETIYSVSIEEDREILSTNYKQPLNFVDLQRRFKYRYDWDLGEEIFGITRTIPVEDAKQFNILCDLNLNADDETTIYESHIDFFDRLFGNGLDDVRREIIFQHKIKKKIPIDVQCFESKILAIKNSFLQRGLAVCHYEKPGYQMIAVLFLEKLFQILRKIKIDSLFAESPKTNPHVSQRKKRI